MASTARIDELKKKFDENPRRYFAPLANEFRKAGDIAQAIVICEEFLPQQPGHMSGHIVYGQALFEAGRLPEARAVFETALGLDPENLIALRHLGDIAHGQADDVAARAWYLRVLDADPRNEEIQALIASLGKAPEAAAQPVAEVPAPVEYEPPKELAGILDDDALEVAPAAAVPPPLVPVDMEFAPPAPAAPPPIPAEPPDIHSYELATPSDETADHETQAAEGFEATTFEPPAEPVHTLSELDASLESGVPEFEAPAHVPTLEGLEGIGELAPEPTESVRATAAAPAVEDLPPLDLDEADTTPPPQGDALEFEIPAAEESGAVTSVAEEIPVELPPQVIAAEAELIDEVIPVDEAAQAPPPPFVTETMAELYLSQGFRDEARSVYEQLLAAHPDDERLQGLVASLAPEHAPPADTGPLLRDFLSRMAARRPGQGAAMEAPPTFADFAEESAGAAEPVSDVAVAESHEVLDGFALATPATGAPVVDLAAFAPPVEEELPVEAPPPPPAPTPSRGQEVAPALERAARTRTPEGSIDALFGTRSTSTSEDSAAAALAQAFGSSSEEQNILTGRPAHAAAGELSLDSVFRDGPRAQRASQSFSFDQFFTGSASTGGGQGGGPRTSGGTTARASGETTLPEAPTGERGAEDIEQFNSWLQGLKPR